MRYQGLERIERESEYGCHPDRLPSVSLIKPNWNSMKMSPSCERMEPSRLIPTLKLLMWKIYVLWLLPKEEGAVRERSVLKYLTAIWSNKRECWRCNTQVGILLSYRRALHNHHRVFHPHRVSFWLIILHVNTGKILWVERHDKVCLSLLSSFYHLHQTYLS